MLCAHTPHISVNTVGGGLNESSDRASGDLLSGRLPFKLHPNIPHFHRMTLQ